MLWVSLLWLAPFFFGDISSTFALDIKIMALVIAPTPLFVLQPLLFMGMEWNAIMWQVSCLFVCYACVPTLHKWLKSDDIARALSSPFATPPTTQSYSARGWLVAALPLRSDRPVLLGVVGVRGTDVLAALLHVLR